MSSSATYIVCGIAVGAIVIAAVRALAKPVVHRGAPAAPPTHRRAEEPAKPEAARRVAPVPVESPTQPSAGSNRVTLVETGSNKIQVIKHLREAVPGLDLAEAKKLTESTPIVVVTPSPEHAAQLYRDLLAVRARVEAHGIEAGLEERTQLPPGAHRVVLQVLGPNKIMAIKVVREATGLGLAEAKHLVESAPITVKETGAIEAQRIVDELAAIGATATAELILN